jgi:hypothetical protein
MPSQPSNSKPLTLNSPQNPVNAPKTRPYRPLEILASHQPAS